MLSALNRGQAALSPLALANRRFAGYLAYGLTSAIRISTQNFHFEFAFKRRSSPEEIYAKNHELKGGVNLDVLLKPQRNIRLLETGQNGFKFALVIAFPNARHGCSVRLMFCLNERYMAIATLQKAITKFRFAKRTEHASRRWRALHNLPNNLPRQRLLFRRYI
jgi:hypothetical protein